MRKSSTKKQFASMFMILGGVIKIGITIAAKNSKKTFTMGYGGFFNLRKNVAFALDKEFGQNYANMGKCITKEEFQEKVHIAEKIIKSKNLDRTQKDVLDFLYLPDTDGSINYRTCKKIADLLEPCLHDLRMKIFQYASYTSGQDYEDFVAFLRECVRYHRNMRWN